MTSVHDLNDIASGDPERLRSEAEALRTITATIDVVVRQLLTVSTHGVWESEAGATFAAQVGQTPGDLDRVSARLHDAAAVIDPYADLLEDNQRRLRQIGERYAEATRTRKACEQRLAELPAEDPDRLRLEREREEAARVSVEAMADFERESDEALADERRAAGRLSDVLPDVGDPRGYDVFEGVTNLGTSARATPVGLLAKPVRIAGLAQAVGLGGRKIFYDEGTWKHVGAAAVGALADIVDVGAVTVISWAKRTTAAPVKATRWTNPPVGAGHPSGKAFGNPIAGRRTRDISGARTSVGRAAQTVKHDTADVLSQKVRRMTGVEQLEQFEKDWLAVAGSRAGAGIIVVGHSTRHVARVTGNVQRGRVQAEKQGLTR